ncbi:MAG: Dna2/Cas4 domain-containing protein [Anaerolineae bacterium]|nr:Dna2/Cas4 domain-containing protein [Anaerolineae bacterium]
MTILFLILAVFLILLALFLLRKGSRQRQAAGLPAGQVVYEDTSQWCKNETPLYDSMLRLTGKPDYLVNVGGIPIPVEVKSGRAPATPYPGHIYQLAAYCLLIARTTGKRPPYGIIHYSNRTFSIDFTDAMEEELLNLLAEMRACEKRTNVDRSHKDAARCAHCGYRSACEQRL